MPDSVDGRFDLLLLHVTLVMLRLKDGNVRQNLFDVMFADMDRSLREMGVGDMGIGKNGEKTGAYQSPDYFTLD